MAKLIDAEPIKNFIVGGLNNPDRKNAFGYDAIQILAEIEFAPTIDPVHAAGGIYCRECGKEWCPVRHTLGDLGYCSAGERKDHGK